MAVQTDLYNFEEVGYDAYDDDDDWWMIMMVMMWLHEKTMIESKLFLIKMDGLANRVGTRVDAQGTQLDRTDPDLFDFNAEVIQSQWINSRYNVLP